MVNIALLLSYLGVSIFIADNGDACNIQHFFILDILLTHPLLVVVYIMTSNGSVSRLNSSACCGFVNFLLILIHLLLWLHKILLYRYLDFSLSPVLIIFILTVCTRFILFV
jgi:hypothetical protein